MNKKYIVRLTDAEREHLEKLIRCGKAHARELLYARILLKTDVEGPDRWTDERIAEAFEVFHRYGGAREAALLRGRPRSGAYAKEARQTEEKGSGRASRGSPDRSGMFGPSGGQGTLELEALGRPNDRTRARGCTLLRDRKAHAQKTNSNPT